MANKPIRTTPTPPEQAPAILEFEVSTLWPIELLQLDFDNPRLQTGSDIASATEEEVITSLAEIAALDELVTSICTNGYKNLEPLIVIGDEGAGPFKVLEGNRRLASIKLILNPELAADLDVKIPRNVPQRILDSFAKVLVYRVRHEDDARDYIGFKHINGPQRWDAYAKARYVADWYKREYPETSIDEIAAKIGDNNNTLRSYIYAILALDQAEDDEVWSLRDRPKKRGRFGFSHLYTALQREEFQRYLGMTDGWSSKPDLRPVGEEYVKPLGEVLGYLYGSVSDDRDSLITSQNPDLKDIGLALVDEKARLILQNRGTLDDARDALKNPTEAFNDALVAVQLRLKRAIEIVPKYATPSELVEATMDEIYGQAELLKLMIDRVAEKAAMKAKRGA